MAIAKVFPDNVLRNAPCRNRTYNLPEQSLAGSRQTACDRTALPVNEGAKRSRTPAEIATKSQPDSEKQVSRGTRGQKISASLLQYHAEKRRVARLVAASRARWRKRTEGL